MLLLQELFNGYGLRLPIWQPWCEPAAFARTSQADKGGAGHLAS